MENFKRLFVVKNGAVGGWSDSDRTSFIIEVVGNYLFVKHKTGRDMFAHEINTAFGRFIEEYEAEFGEKIAIYERRYPYRFCFRQGGSGCQDTFIEINKGDGFPERQFIMHESCYGKTAGFTCFVYDFLDLCVAAGFFDIDEGNYVYPGEEIEYELTSVKPRLTKYEEGWRMPGDRPSGVVYLKTCREEVGGETTVRTENTEQEEKE